MRSDLTTTGSDERLIANAGANPEMSSPRPPLTRQVGWTLAGNVGYAAAQSITVIVLAKFLAPATVGQFGLGVAIATPILMFTNLQLRSLQATEVAKNIGFGHYFAFRCLSTLVAILLVVSVIAIVGYSVATALVIVAVTLMKGVEALSDTVYGHLQRAEEMDRIALSMLMKGVLSVGLLIWAILATRNAAIGALAITLGFATVLLLYDLPSSSKTRNGQPAHSIDMGDRAQVPGDPPLSRKKAFRLLFRTGLPLGLTSVLLAITANSPRYFLERIAGESNLGYFVALAYPSAVFSILLSAFGQAAVPRMAEYHRTDPSKFRGLVVRMSMIPLGALIAVGGVALCLGPRSLSLLYRAEYQPYFPEFLMLLVAGALWGVASVLGYAATSSRRLAGQAPAAAVICGGTVLLAMLSISRLGIYGAAAVSIVSGLLGIVSFGLLLLKKPDEIGAAGPTTRAHAAEALVARL